MDSVDPSGTVFNVGVVPVPGFALMSYACCVEPLRAANLLARRKLYDIFHIGWDGVSQSSGAAGVAIRPPDERMPRLDLLLVVAGGNPFAAIDQRITRWLQEMARRGVQVGGVSGGPVVLARAGLMKGRRMTVHWEHAAALAEIDPELMLERRLYVIDRDRVTCGGGTAPLDLMHAVIAEHRGAAFARLVSDWFLHTEVRLAGAPQRGSPTERLGALPGPMLDAVQIMEDHLADPLSLKQLAQVAGVSPRHLNRLFRERMGESTMSYYRRLRLELGRDLLARSPLAVQQVAAATGFAGAAHFASAYSRQFAMTPRQARLRTSLR